MKNSLRVKRAERRVTQLWVAREAGLTTSRLSYIENEQLDPTPDEIAAIARALDTTPETLFPGLAQQPTEQVQ